MTQAFPQELIQAMRKVTRLVVLTGAGVSAESGVPTFRDPQDGLWSRFRPEDLANAAAFRRDPQLVWDWYQWRRRLIAAAGPNAAHRALVRLEARFPEFSLITQNVDGLHSLAGNRKLIELHGNIMRNRCFNENLIIDAMEGDEERPPRCAQCGGPLRPDVVWFGEALPQEALARAVKAVRSCELFFSVGTSSVVRPAAELPLLALEGGATVVEINPEQTPLSSAVHLSLRGSAGPVLSRLVMAAWPDGV